MPSVSVIKALPSSPAQGSRRSQRARTTSSTMPISASASSSSTNSAHVSDGCSIRNRLRRLCRGVEGRLDTPTPLPPLDAEGTPSRCPSMRSLLSSGPLRGFARRPRSGSSDLEVELPSTLDEEEDLTEKEEDILDSDVTEPHISFSYTPAQPSSDEGSSEDQVDATLPVASPSPVPTSINIQVASHLGLSPGRVRRRDSHEDDLDEQLSTYANSSSPRHLPFMASYPRNDISPPPRARAPLGRAPLGQAPIPFRTSFLPQPPTNDSRPAILPNLSRYTQETETAPNELPIYRHYRQVRRRTALSAATALLSAGQEIPRENVPNHREEQIERHVLGSPHLGHVSGRVDVESNGEIESDSNTDAQSEAERPDISSDSPGSSGRESDATSTLASSRSSVPVPAYQASTTTATGIESPAYTPPTPPAMFMASNGLGQYPAAAAGAGVVPPFPPLNTGASFDPVSRTTRLHWELSQRPHLRIPSWADPHPPPGLPQPTRPYTTDTVTSDGVSDTHDNPIHVPSIGEMFHRQRHEPRQQTPYSNQPTAIAPAIWNWDTEWLEHAPPVPNTARQHIGPDYNTDLHVQRPVFNVHGFYNTAQVSRPPPPNAPPTLPRPGPPRHPAAMPSRAESLYSRLARLDSLRSENPLYRGEIPRPYLPVNEMTSTRRSVHHGRTASSANPYGDFYSGLPAIPPFVQDSTYRSTTSQWSSSSSSGINHSRWASRGGSTASNAGSAREREHRRPISRQDVNRTDTNLSWFSSSFPYDDIPYYGIGGTETPQPLDQRVAGQQSNPPSPPAAIYGGSPTWNPEEAFPQSLLGEWGDLMGHVPIDTIGEGLHDPMMATARDNVHPFARTRDNLSVDYNSTSGQSTSSTSPPPPPPLGLYDFMEPVPPLIPSRPPFDPFRASDEHLTAFVASRSGLGGTVTGTGTGGGPVIDTGIQAEEYVSPRTTVPRRSRDTTLSAFIQSQGGGAAVGSSVSGPGNIEGSGGGLWMTDRQYTTHQQSHAQALAHAHSHRRYHYQAPLSSNTSSHVPAIAPRVLSPSFLRHYRIDKNWPLEKQKHIVRVVVRLLNSFTPVHKKLEAQSVLRYVYWEDAGNVCETRGMEKETCCAICYEDYQPAQKLAITPCNHMYHKHCLNTWFDTPLTNVASSAPTSCPMCRRNLAALALITRIVWSREMEDALPLWMDTMVNAVDTEVLNMPE